MYEPIHTNVLINIRGLSPAVLASTDNTQDVNFIYKKYPNVSKTYIICTNYIGLNKTTFKFSNIEILLTVFSYILIYVLY